MKLILGDCLEKLKELPTNSVDMVLADLPYGTTACKWDTIIPFEPLWEQLNRVGKPNAAIVMFGSEPFSSLMRMSNLKQFRYDWVWRKNKPTGMLNAKRMPMRDYELISIFSEKPTLFFPIKEPRVWKTSIPKNATYKSYASKNVSNGKHRDTQRKAMAELRFPTMVQCFDSIATRKEQVHPTQKPVDLLEYLIKTYTKAGDTVLDPTMGSGSTGVASRNTGRKFVGIERDREYFSIAKSRILAPETIDEIWARAMS